MKIAQATLNFYEEAVNQQLPGVTAADIAAEDRGFGALVSRFFGVALSAASLLLLFYLVWGAIDWMTSGGDKGKVEKARNKITQAVIGLLVLLASVALITLLQGFFNFEVLRFSQNTTPTTNTVNLPAFCDNDPCATGYTCDESRDRCVPSLNQTLPQTCRNNPCGTGYRCVENQNGFSCVPN